jgi:predicted anti-sigma-YlaC factor YlaD
MNLSCRESTRLMSQREDRALTLAESAALTLHLGLCRGCRAVSTQFSLLRRALKQLFDEKA